MSSSHHISGGDPSRLRAIRPRRGCVDPVSGRIRMADIALLVAEDFQRSRKRWETEEDHGRGRRRRTGEECFGSSASFAGSALGRQAREKVSSSKEVESAVEPRSSFGVAAFDGLFSA